jgi:hypothetical protein
MRKAQGSHGLGLYGTSSFLSSQILFDDLPLLISGSNLSLRSRIQSLPSNSTLVWSESSSMFNPTSLQTAETRTTGECLHLPSLWCFENICCLASKVWPLLKSRTISLYESVDFYYNSNKSSTKVSYPVLEMLLSLVILHLVVLLLIPEKLIDFYLERLKFYRRAPRTKNIYRSVWQTTN